MYDICDEARLVYFVVDDFLRLRVSMRRKEKEGMGGIWVERDGRG
jgi:hypothetical protein